jgi:hypothetical protein
VGFKYVHLLWWIKVLAGRKGGVDERVVGDGNKQHDSIGYNNCWIRNGLMTFLNTHTTLTILNTFNERKAKQ